MQDMSSGPQQDSTVEAALTDLAGAWLFAQRSWNTRAAYEADLAWFAAWCARAGRSPLGVTQDDVERFRTESEAAGAAPATTRRRLAALTSFFDYAVTAGEVAENPAEGVARPASERGSSTAELDEDEAQTLLAAADDLGPKSAVLVALLLLDGLKLGEALSATLSDLGASPPSLTVTRQGRRQAIALHATTATAIEVYVAGRSAGPLLLGNSVTEPARLSRSGAHHILKNASSRAGITKTVSANTLRRSYATTAQAGGASLDEIRASLGHYDRRTTRRLLPEKP